MEMTWKYPCDERKYDKLKVILPTKTIQVNQTDKWEKSGKYFFYHDTLEKYLRLKVWPFNSKDNGTYGFNCDENAKKSEVKIVEKTHCKTLNQTAYRTAKTTIKCDYPHMYLSKTKFICKENNFTCKSILTTKSSKNSTGRFTLTHTSSDFNLSISPVSLNDAGVYWCGVIESNGSYQAGISKIQLEVKNITMFPRLRTPGQDLKYYCKYGSNFSNLTKCICKGENQDECRDVGSTTNNMSRRFMMKDNKINNTITIEVRNVTVADSGTYWCGANKDNSKIFIHKLALKVGESFCSYPDSDSLGVV
ncbi:uncharacterized protein LOC114135040 [Xiphophorus couchianus]|uniref:uncharacterized protein LOC114135040 n=1 Tax=Xiphophorus couchianus TaxID=32473 RepID=UPI001016B0A3|nr:uncharacterized protein LOC114135040 [Xiphophorus couchianus]